MPLNARLHPREPQRVPDGAAILIDGEDLDDHLATIRADVRTVGPVVRLPGLPTNACGTLPRRPPRDRYRTGRGPSV